MTASRQKVLLLVGLLFVLPALVTLVLLTSNAKIEFVDGAQPGGVVAGRVARSDGSPCADVDVVALKVTGNLIGDELARTRTDAGGAFEVTLPPLQGRYVLRFSGTALQEALVEHGWIGQGNAAITPPPLAVEMRAGCRLEVEIVGPDKAPAGSGKFEISGATGGGLLSGFAQAHLSRSGSVEGGKFTVDGLPPMSARLHVRLDSGERVDSVLDLTEGSVRHRIEL